MTEFILGLEIRPKTRIGGGLTIFHGYGLVVHDHCIIGDNVTLRNGVTIGQANPGGGVPTIGDRVQIGANASIIGQISVGTNSVIGAGSVVVKNVPANCVAAGNPARIIRTNREETTRTS
ncbi:DapH/DapD/GlmU-related protein [Rhodococcus sp. AW25M09]|uniref:serine O-acetyltransferase n=1 Tax=Rhodococcus sp. AW25M09 TaxID=1268303 RepID=UPI0018DEE0EB